MPKHTKPDRTLTYPFPTDKRFRNLLGRRFGRLRVVQYNGQTQRPNGAKGHTRWICKCDCGTIVSVFSYNFGNGHTQSCGCLQKERLGNATRIHSMSHTTEHGIWMGMRDRCSNPKSPDWSSYGGRGIKVCKRWHHFQCFYEDMGDRPRGKSLDRRDNNGNYEPGNCRWATPIEQGANTRSVKLVTFKGVTLSLAGWERQLGFKKGRVTERIYEGWTVIEALTTPVKKLKQFQTKPNRN